MNLNRDDLLTAKYIEGVFLYATEAIRSLIFLSAIGIIALFMAAVYFSANNAFIVSWRFVWALGLFFASGIMGSVSFGTSYLSQGCFIQFETPGARKVGEFWQLMAIMTAAAAFGVWITAVALTLRIIAGP